MPDRSSPDHLLVPFAAADDACHATLGTLELPALSAVLQRWYTTGPVRGDIHRYNTPHEQALASALGWAPRRDGTLPLAAWHAGVVNRPCAWFHLCHWTVGMEQVSLQPVPPSTLTEEEACRLWDALRPLAEEDGLTLVPEQPTRWRAEGEVFRDLPWPSLDRVAHRRLDGWLPNTTVTPAVRPLLRLLNEAQMLFYTHPVNDARAARGLPTVNGLWISGSGWLSDREAATAPPPPRVNDTLREAVLQGDWGAWAAAWRALDRDVIAPWLEPAMPATPRSLTLCGERHYQTWHTQPPSDNASSRGGWRQALRRILPRRPPRASVRDILASL